VKSKKHEIKDIGFDEITAFFVPLANLAAVGIKNKMKPSEVVNYFMDIVNEFTQKMDEKMLDFDIDEEMES
jgi:hypothetical protein